MKLSSLKNIFPSGPNALLALLSAVLLILAFPDFEFWFLAWFALIPLFFVIDREKDFWRKSFFAGWLFGTAFFFGSCWWLTFAPITYAGFPALLAYILMFFAALAVGFFPAVFAALFSILLKRTGPYAIFSAPFFWTASEFLRLWATGNNWNALGYSQAFSSMRVFGSIGGVLLVSFICAAFNAFFTFSLLKRTKTAWLLGVVPFLVILFAVLDKPQASPASGSGAEPVKQSNVIAVQPNVPMSGIKYEDWDGLRQRHVRLAEDALQKINEQRIKNNEPVTIIFPESPMIFLYSEDPEFRAFIKQFAVKNNAYILFNAAEPDENSKHNFNSAVMVNPGGEKIVQYDKIHLLPFGEFMPLPEFLGDQLPAFVGSFSFGSKFNLMPLGEAKGGVMICFESHFGSLSREYAKLGADVLIEMTNDGYLGNTPVLRQHLASSVFRAVEINRPLLRVTNVGITAYISQSGEVQDPAEVYKEASRVWTVAKSDGSQTLYVRYGDWAAWLCSAVSLVLLLLVGFWKKNSRENARKMQ